MRKKLALLLSFALLAATFTNTAISVRASEGSSDDPYKLIMTEEPKPSSGSRKAAGEEAAAAAAADGAAAKAVEAIVAKALAEAEADAAASVAVDADNRRKEELRPGACEGSCRSKQKRNTHVFLLSCGGKTRTCDLQVMSLASYQLLHSAIYTTNKPKTGVFSCFAGAKVRLFSEPAKLLNTF